MFSVSSLMNPVREISLPPRSEVRVSYRMAVLGLSGIWCFAPAHLYSITLLP